MGKKDKKDKKDKKNKSYKKRFDKKQSTQFLNVDLDIESKCDISPITKGFGDNVFVLNDKPHSEGIYNLSVELTDSGDSKNPEEFILSFIKLIESFSDDAKDAWDKAYKKTFDLGYECGFIPSCINNELSTDTLKAVASVGASIAFTLYSVQKKDCK